MRKPFVAGNWKMNKTVEQARELVSTMMADLNKIAGVEKVICPPYTSLLPLAAMLKGTEIGLGAQNLHWEASGAYTGELSASMVAEFCQYVIIGHSERRAYFAEIDETVNKKVFAALNANLTPIVCVGETLSENEDGKTSDVITRQILAGLKGVSNEQATRLVVAYEPVWAIGTGKAANPQIANDVTGKIVRPALAKLFGTAIADQIRVLYGGSVTGANAAEYFNQPEVDGALVGGASLKPADFLAIVQSAVK
jgi:triosephosphate isomerase (TIM)